MIRINQKKYHLVRWNVVFQPIQHGGLGIHSIAEVNCALLEKWLWRLGEDGNALWKQPCIAKYNIHNDGWYILLIQYGASSIWKSVLSTLDNFTSCNWSRVSRGSRVHF